MTDEPAAAATALPTPEQVEKALALADHLKRCGQDKHGSETEKALIAATEQVRALTETKAQWAAAAHRADERVVAAESALTALTSRATSAEAALARLASSEALTSSFVIDSTPTGKELVARLEFARAALPPKHEAE
jgi:hypothetical protein